MTTIPFLGEAAAIACALCWAFAVTAFRRPIAVHGPWAVNLARSVIAAGLLGVTALALGEAPALFAAPRGSLAVVALSGLVGLTLGDTALFAAVGRLGAHRALLFQTLAPIFAAVLAIGFYGEALRAERLAGTALVIVGIALVISGHGRPAAPTTSAPSPEASGGERLGYALAVLAAFGQGTGIVLAKDGMEDLPLVSASFVRMAAAAVAMTLVMAVNGRLPRAVSALATGESLRQIVPPTFLGAYVAFILMMAGVALAPASVAAVLIATSPIWSLFIDRLTVGTPITPRGLLGTFVAVAGVAVLTIAG